MMSHSALSGSSLMQEPSKVAAMARRENTRVVFFIFFIIQIIRKLTSRFYLDRLHGKLLY